MCKFDPPSDPYGGEHNCRLCDCPMEFDQWADEWYCDNDNCPHPPEVEAEETEEE